MALYRCILPPSYSSKLAFFSDLAAVGQAHTGPWIIMGDFNCITSQAEKLGGRAFASSSSSGLLQFMDEFGLLDLRFSGHPFTWNNKRSLSHNIHERLDRGIANILWRTLFPNASIQHLPAHHSNHKPLLLSLFSQQPSQPRPFRFESMWLREPSIQDVVESAWCPPARGSPMFSFLSKLHHTKSALRDWNHTTFGNVHRIIRELHSLIEHLQNSPQTSSTLTREEHL